VPGRSGSITSALPSSARARLTRRGALAAAALSAALAAPGVQGARRAAAQPPGTEPANRPLDTALRRRAAEIREAGARRTGELAIAPHPANDDEARYPNRIGTDTRALPHDARGEVDQAAWRALFDACQTGDPADFERIPLGGTRRLGNPVGTMAVSYTGVTPTHCAIPAPPALSSAERAAEAVEVYWQALLRDVPFAEYSDHPQIREAADELGSLKAFGGARAGALGSPFTLFRGAALYFDASDPNGRAAIPPGALDGPMVSQFLLRDVPFGAQWISARIRPAEAGTDFLGQYDEWLKAQNGEAVSGQLRLGTTPRYISCGRDLAEAVRSGLAQPTVMAFLLATPAGGTDPRYGGLFPLAQPATSPTNPYRRSRNQTGGAATFGLTHMLGVLHQAANYGPRAAYWQKWFVHRTLRPEAYGGLAHHRLINGVSDYPVHDDFLRSAALDRTRAKQGTGLLTQNAPEGAPIFSAYPGGGASLAGATVTILKAFFDESRVFENPMQPDPRDPTQLVPYAGPPLTVGGELNKLATNLAWGRNWMGIHFWSDAAASLALGEEVAIGILRDEHAAYRERFDGFAFRRFDGTRVTV
jgi:hypothetical protein